MDASIPAARPQPSLKRRLQTSWRRGLLREYRLVGALALVTAVLPVAVALSPANVPLVSFMVPLLVGSLVLGPRQLHWFVIWVLVMLLLAITLVPDIEPRTAAAVGIEFLMAFIVLLSSFRRSRLGVAGAMGEAMLVDLRDRIINQGGVPSLPQGWRVESALRSAGGTPFAGDFMVATMPEPHRIELVVVDVSGKGEQAGTRALMLSGAFGGLLGALPPEQFLPCANDYLLRQDWGEGFATAVHLSADLRTGAYEVRSAGHPPALHRHAGSGRWSVLESAGPALGLLAEAEYDAVRGVLEPDDAVLLYTDGMVEEPRRDNELGIDRLLGEADGLLHGDVTGAADRLVDTLGSRADDRAVLVLNRG